MVAQIIGELFAVFVLWSGNVIRQEELNPATHIYTYRQSGLYSHHGIYIGEDNIIHFTRTGVNKTSLDSFRREGEKLHSLHSYAYGRPLLEYWLMRWGTRTTLPDAKLPEEVINKAWELYEGNSFGKYDLINNNCEHFAVFCRTGVRASAQTALVSIGQHRAKEVKEWIMKLLHRIKLK
ncbi:lecithin retinol acyltransferase-like [Eucalyptus grandis]|uniref:lecithin retinol acyltransferase-like n=1 Tax=Eucalyptus grandis TaxID=71139 RepID=UPI00192ED76B|nr:lecithin retinol acyltransferase-like [Eucalyptus grandis]